ncbi:hypothetical protein GWK48_03665 [Metallosphaera tengchongensis]|uniref:Uncharacterized protein n=1 Tax=Metallosphaera tengchongensis TaxID=1532350 RepID=A0A6N0NV76_9CREN|nr:cell division protein CdvB3 [Metallosphaera tengchongensis]QKQ99608.1 hypothetical protein GWK48_03665 [Metallosphaera tengchongensis]
MKKDIRRVLMQTKTARAKLRVWQNRLNQRSEQYRRLSLANATRFSTLAEQYVKESDQLDKIVSFLNTLDVLLEMLEIKLETVSYIDYIPRDLLSVVEGLKEFSRLTPTLGTEFSIIIDELYTGFYNSVEVPKDVRIKAKEEAKGVIAQAEKIAKGKTTEELST